MTLKSKQIGDLTSSLPMGASSSIAVTAGAKGRYTIPYAGDIIGWTLISNVNCTLVLDVWKANNAIPTNANSIFSTKPSLTAAQLNSSSITAIPVAKDDVFILEVEFNDVATFIRLDLTILQK